MNKFMNIAFLFISISLAGQTVNMTTKWQAKILSNLSTVESKDNLNNIDFGELWTETDNKYIYGIIGENCQRLRIKILSTKRQSTNKDVYDINGKFMAMKDISEFRGTITINSIRVYNTMHFGVDNTFKNKGIQKQGLLIAKYHFEESKTQTHSGVYEGLLYTSWLINKLGKVQYDKIEFNSDNYRNNQFIGTWYDYKTKKKLICNWGDFRVPNSMDLDMGVAEFYPADKYLKFGWQSCRDYYKNNNKQARQEEEKQWWK